MDKAEFWRIIDRARAASGGDPNRQAEQIVEELVQRPVEDILAYAEIFYEYFDYAYDARLWDAAYLVGCGCSDDGFMDFRTGLIAQGKVVYENALHNPESLADVLTLGQDTKYPVISIAIWNAYEQKTGNDDLLIFTREMPELRHEEESIDGGDDETDEKSLQRYPRLRALYEYYCAHFND